MQIFRKRKDSKSKDAIKYVPVDSSFIPAPPNNFPSYPVVPVSNTTLKIISPNNTDNYQYTNNYHNHGDNFINYSYNEENVNFNLNDDETFVASRSVSTYAAGVAEPNADKLFVQAYPNAMLVVTSDGQGWGRRPAQAAERAVTAIGRSVNYLLPMINNTLDVATVLRNSLAEAHQNIIVGHEDFFDVAKTGVCVSFCVELQTPIDGNKWAVIIAHLGLGGALIHRFGSRHMEALIDMDFEANCSRGCLGPYMEDGKPFVQNLKYEFTLCNSGDHVMVMSDGVHNNFAPFCVTNGRTTDPKIKLSYIRKLFFTPTSPSFTPSYLANVAIENAEAATFTARLYDSHHQRVPAHVPGNMDHTTCVVFRVGYNPDPKQVSSDSNFKNVDAKSSTHIEHLLISCFENIWLSRLIPLIDILPYLSLLSKCMRSTFLPIIRANFTFRLTNGRKMQTLEPQQVIVDNISAIPPSATNVTFDFHFNQTLENLPQNIQILSFGNSFNQPVHNLLPPTLRHLTFGAEFNMPVKSLPPLTTLTFGTKFNQMIDQLPNSITHLILGLYYDQPITSLPSSLISLHINGFPFFPNPKSKKLISLPTEFPPSLTSLSFGFCFNQVLENLPPNLTSLSFGSCFNQPLKSLPSSLCNLTFGHSFNQPISDLLPPTLTHLTFGQSFNQPLDYIPPSLCVLVLGKKYRLLASLLQQKEKGYQLKYLPDDDCN